jgi:glyoxylase-like metal-dependent hydrolase (beta-lactamase superfamily II)
MVPLHGHSRGHAAIAVDSDDGWLLHCGDAYFFHGEMDPSRPHCPIGLRAFQRSAAIDDQKRRWNQRRLRALVREHAHEVKVFSAHDPAELTPFTE